MKVKIQSIIILLLFLGFFICPFLFPDTKSAFAKSKSQYHFVQSRYFVLTLDENDQYETIRLMIDKNSGLLKIPGTYNVR